MWFISNLLRAMGKPLVPAPFLWQLIRGGYCNEWVQSTQHGQLRADVIFFTSSSLYQELMLQH